ncbi:LOW QUALITY PROTEIN: hypothetical protein GQ55_5G102200 [Panicum hallii var. hallii]|uniref:TROVE domain-containing protein n=1 Tax=Panicum hallii var. hallii TaxID=1504633 RepID=A0A2T7DET2_9POAL|nr:LOW QUALITY PROTEIN: hypothetical protein GQ55_5G102200 [Panicum hallii var. hallii]
MAPASTLVGPPVAVAVAFNADPKPQPKPTCGSFPDYPSDENSSMDEDSPAPGPATEKEVGRPLAYASSGDPCVDFFFQIVPGVTSDADLAALLDAAWSRDARTALKLVCHLRGVRGLGKSDRDGFYAAALWMHARHPLTLAANLARFGCLKDLPEILYLVLRGPRDDDNRKGDGRCQGEAALARYATDEAFRHLYDRVADTFAELLKSDVEHLRAGDTAKIGLEAKWCPSLRSSYDRSTLLCEAIARRIFPRESNQEYLNLSDKHYTYRVRNQLRREVLVPLRKVLELPEVYMSAGNGTTFRNARVASVAMHTYKEAFQKRDKPRVSGFFDEVRTGHARVPAGAVLPHEMIAAALKGEHDEAAELQWCSMVSALAAEGRLDNCIAVCGLTDPATSAAIALGLLISELSQEPWKGRVITFEETHQLHKLHGANLKVKLQPLVAALGPRKKGANLQGVFSKILSTAVAGGLRRDMMVKRVFVLSDMDFDGWAGSAAAWVTEYQGISNHFSAEGFAAPEVVFWNVGTSKASMPVVAAQEGAALVSGYSKNLVRLFLEADGNLTPATVMAGAISGPEYDALEVFV